MIENIILLLLLFVIILILLNNNNNNNDHNNNHNNNNHNNNVNGYRNYENTDMLGRQLKENTHYVKTLNIYQPLLKGTKRNVQKCDISKYIDNSLPNNYRCINPDPKNYMDLSMMASNGPPE